MIVEILFFACLALTLVTMFLAIASGRRGRRKQHLARALATVVLLAVSVLLALKLGTIRDFPPEQMGIHKIFARAAGLLVLPAAITGILLWRQPRWRTAHKVCVYLLVLVSVIAVGTGVWVFTLSTPKPV